MGMREEIEGVKAELDELKHESFAFELLKDQRKQNKRLFIILITVLTMWFATIGAFVYYISNYSYEETIETYTTDFDTEGNGIIDIGGDVNNG